MTNTTKQVTPKAMAALDKLRAMQPFPIVPERTIRARESRKLVTIPAHIETGINTTILFNLREAGLIACEHLWLCGHTTPDLRIVEIGG
jgi:hypothetical protein